MKRLLTTGFLLFSAFAYASSGVVPMGQDTFMISAQSFTGFSSAGSVKADIYKEGSAYCATLGKEFQPVNDHGVDGVPGRSFASAEVQFRCLNKGDPELSRPTMKPIANVRIESDAREKVEIRDKRDGRSQGIDDMYASLKKLKDLLDSGIITQQEFDEQKKKILAQ
ncbi:MAG: SHOCT domain-containing protein [Rhodoferax sp.]|nr:SHOCT domain-containing protein [Rhodoferax sp.]